MLTFVLGTSSVMVLDKSQRLALPVWRFPWAARSSWPLLGMY